MTYSVESALGRLKLGAQRRGRRFWIHCPRASDPSRHEGGDRNPSCSVWSNEVSQKSGLWHCFSCHAGGNLPQLVALVLGLKDDFLGTGVQKAHEWLRSDAAPEPTYQRIVVNTGVVRRPIFQLPPEVVFEPLDRWPTSMRSYAEERCLTPEQVERWGIGYAVDGWLRGRIVLVTRSARGVPVNYSARAIGASPRRYLMADSRDGADKRVIFGEQHWGSLRTIVLTEGAFDALAVERVARDALGEEVAVGALSGSHVGPAVVARLSRFERFIVGTDADSAGERAARLLLASFVRTREILRLAYPRGQDANSLPPEDLSVLLRGMINR